jgi:hypothetical protein
VLTKKAILIVLSAILLFPSAPGSSAAWAAPAAADTPDSLAAAAVQTITLITGDRVLISRDGIARILPGPGRDRVGFTELGRAPASKRSARSESVVRVNMLDLNGRQATDGL